MEIIIIQQATALAFALLLGVALGLVYDLLRPIRRRAAVSGTIIIDTLYAIISGCGIFIFAMSAPSGRLGVWELAMSLLGFLAYINLISDRVYSITDGIYSLTHRVYGALKEKVGKFLNMTKLFFQNVQK